MQDCNRDWLEGQALWLYKRQSRTEAKGGRTEKKLSDGNWRKIIRKPETEAKGEHRENQGTTGEANETETESSIGQPTHEC